MSGHRSHRVALALAFLLRSYRCSAVRIEVVPLLRFVGLAVVLRLVVFIGVEVVRERIRVGQGVVRTPSTSAR